MGSLTRKVKVNFFKWYKWVCLDCHETIWKAESINEIYCTELSVKDSYENKILSAIPVFQVVLKCTVIVVTFCRFLAQTSCCVTIDWKVGTFQLMKKVPKQNL